ncbi:hypothetical protein ABKN59_005447 [Abortiporus biennis]
MQLTAKTCSFRQRSTALVGIESTIFRSPINYVLESGCKISHRQPLVHAEDDVWKGTPLIAIGTIFAIGTGTMYGFGLVKGAFDWLAWGTIASWSAASSVDYIHRLNMYNRFRRAPGSGEEAFWYSSLAHTAVNPNFVKDILKDLKPEQLQLGKQCAAEVSYKFFQTRESYVEGALFASVISHVVLRPWQTKYSLLRPTTLGSVIATAIATTLVKVVRPHQFLHDYDGFNNKLLACEIAQRLDGEMNDAVRDDVDELRLYKPAPTAFDGL